MPQVPGEIGGAGNWGAYAASASARARPRRCREWSRGASAKSGRELAARGLDVAAARQPHRHRHARTHELVLEPGDRLAGGSVVDTGRVVRDQVDLEVVAA